LDLTLLVILTWLSGMSDGDKCDESGGIFTNVRDIKDVQEVTLKVKADASSPEANVVLCLIKEGVKCLAINGDGLEEGIARKIERQAAQTNIGIYTFMVIPPAGASREQELAIKRAAYLPLSHWICASGTCGQDDKCVPGPLNTATWDIEAVKTEEKAAEDKKIGEVESEIKKENEAKEEQRKKEEKDAATRDRDRDRTDTGTAPRLSSGSVLLLVLGLRVVLLAQGHGLGSP
jgi:hypothetical protein